MISEAVDLLKIIAFYLRLYILIVKTNQFLEANLWYGVPDSSGRNN